MRQRPITTPTSRINRSVLRVYFFWDTSIGVDISTETSMNVCNKERKTHRIFPRIHCTCGWVYLPIKTHMQSHFAWEPSPSGILYTLQHKHKHTNEERRRRVLLVALERFAELARSHPPDSHTPVDSTPEETQIVRPSPTQSCPSWLVPSYWRTA